MFPTAVIDRPALIRPHLHRLPALIVLVMFVFPREHLFDATTLIADGITGVFAR